MASSTLMTLSSAPLVSNKGKGMLSTKAVAPCSVIFQPRSFGKGGPSSRLSLVRAQQVGDNKDTSVDVQVNQGNQGTTIERRPRRLAVDISPFGNYHFKLSLSSSSFFFFPFLLVDNKLTLLAFISTIKSLS